MNTNLEPRELADALTRRSACQVQVAAVINDRHGVFAWGWNSQGPTGMGQCAETHAISRANARRVRGATVTVSAWRKRRGRRICSAPCVPCLKRLTAAGVRLAVYRNHAGHWVTEELS